ncbi:MAG: hypothetical protein ACYTGZ_03265 [Planctomycetota bacterium]
MIRRLSRGMRLALYGAVPLVLIGAMVALYYSDVPALRRIVSPDTAEIDTDLRREFGLLENLQNVALAATAVVALVGLRRKRLPLERLALIVLAAGAVFVLLEEIDYGFQYAGEQAPHNIHRIGYTETVLNNAARFGLLTFFGAFAILFSQSRNTVLRYIAPDPFSVLTILLVTALQELVWRLRDQFPLSYGSLTGNEIEFAELGVYYLILVYAVDMVFWRDYDRYDPPDIAVGSRSED